MHVIDIRVGWNSLIAPACRVDAYEFEQIRTHVKIITFLMVRNSAPAATAASVCVVAVVSALFGFQCAFVSV